VKVFPAFELQMLFYLFFPFLLFYRHFSLLIPLFCGWTFGGRIACPFLTLTCFELRIPYTFALPVCFPVFAPVSPNCGQAFAP